MLVTILILWSNNWIYFRLDKREKVKKNTVKYLYVSFHFKDSLFLSPPSLFLCMCVYTCTRECTRGDPQTTSVIATQESYTLIVETWSHTGT